MNKRLDGDIFSKNPTVLMVTFGMNDSGYYEYNGDNAKDLVNRSIRKASRTSADGKTFQGIATYSYRNDREPLLMMKLQIKDNTGL